jgi:hypothetical protein
MNQCPKTQEEEEDMSRVPYASAIGSLMYAMVCTRPDIAHTVGVLSSYMSKPGKEHWTIVKRVFRYLRGITSYGLCYQGRLGLDRVLGGTIKSTTVHEKTLRSTIIHRRTIRSTTIHRKTIQSATIHGRTI